MHIRTRLVILVLSVLIPAFTAGGLAVWFVYHEQRQAQEKVLMEAAHTLALLIDKELLNTEGMLKVLATSPLLARGDLHAFYDHAKLLAPAPDSAIVLSNPEGRQLLNTRLPFGSPAPSLHPGVLALRRRLGEDKTIVSDLYLGPVSKRQSYAVQVPVAADGAVRYYLSHSIEAITLHRLLAQQNFPKNWIGSVVDRHGAIVARTENAERFIGRYATGSMNDKILQGLPSGTNEGQTLDGKRVIAFFHRAPASEWTVVLSVPLSEVRRPALQAALLLTGLMTVIMLAALFIARAYAARTIQPMRRLRYAAERLGRGEEVPHVASDVIEMDAVSAAISAASVQIRRNKEDLERRVAEAVAATERAQRALLQAQKLEALGRLTGGIAHDFNNVLQTLTISLQLIRMEQDQERILALTAACERAVARATALIGQLRAFGRVQEASFETIDPARAIEAALPMLQSALPSDIRFELHLDSPLWPVTVDPVQFELALLNIVINARDAMPDGGTLALNVRNAVLHDVSATLPAGDYLRIDITDTGMGMAPEVLEKALDPFFTTKPVDKGSGLGLPQAYGFALQAKGSLALDSAEGAGTTVTIHLPRAMRQPGARAAQNIHAAPAAAAGTVLFVDDDELLRELAATALTQAGFSVVVARNGDEALTILETGHPIDVLFSDIVMPGEIGGIELARRIRNNYPEIALVLATGYTDKQIEMPGVRLLAKPYQMSDAIAALQAAAEAAHLHC